MKTKFLIFFFLILTGCQTLTVTEKEKTKSKFHVDIAKNFLNYNKNPEAIAELQKALKLNPENADAHHQMALCLYARGKYNDAAQSFHRSLEIEPSNTFYRNNYVTLLIEMRRYAEAFRHSKISVADLTYPKPEESLYLQAQASSQLAKKYPQMKVVAKTTLEQTLKYNPKHCGALYGLADLYSHSKELKKSYIFYHKSLENCQVSDDKIKALDALIPLSKKFGLVYQWGRYKQLRSKITKKPTLLK
jgi:type IV pilus assembly protein PilF